MCWPLPQPTEVTMLQATRLGPNSVATPSQSPVSGSLALRQPSVGRIFVPAIWRESRRRALTSPQTRSPAFHARCGRADTRPLRDRCTAKRSVVFDRSSATTGARLSGLWQGGESLWKIALIGVVTWRDSGCWPISLGTDGADADRGNQLQRHRLPFPVLSGEGVVTLSEDAGFLGSVDIWR